MNYFLGEAWITLLARTGSIARPRRLHVGGDAIWVGEYQNVRQRKWQLYGSDESGGSAWLQELFAQGRDAGVFQIECAFNMARWSDQELLHTLGVTITEEFGTYEIDLRGDEAALWSGVHSSHRTKINRGKREGLQVCFSFDCDPFISLMDQTYARGGDDNPFSRDYLQLLLATSGSDMLLVGITSPRGLEAGSIIPLDAERGYFLHGATRLDAPPGASALLHWQTMLALKERGIPLYDLGGARRETQNPRLKGIFQFKERFGGRFQPCWYWRKVIHPGRKWLHDGTVWITKHLP
ncbi:MAG: peptidoglycan bridge formation glycyltransferase FemA/FemB family protein [Magnetococcales bacterium]|nr:peptidoglycan bridge formation glycyltransferase FemA/FemB family protein [Magnetococcales bacterium]